ncbi:DDE_3 domain-containing protein [Trichonephila clavipes]|nr:DDE_3 domain-containing protein [Trichonephila clavipes]
MNQWVTILFTDESHFSLNTDSNHTFIWREPGTRHLPSNVRKIDNYGGRGLIIWASILLDGRTPLHVFEIGSVTAVRYRVEVLEPYVCLFRGAWIGQTSTLYCISERSGEGNCYSQPPSENENSVAEQVGPIALRTDKLPYFKYDITLRGLYSSRVQRSSSTVIRVWKKWTDELRTTRKTGSGRRKVTSARENKHLHRMGMNDLLQAVGSTLVYSYRCTNVSFANSLKSAAPWIVCKGAFIQDPIHGKPSMAPSAMGS